MCYLQECVGQEIAPALGRSLRLVEVLCIQVLRGDFGFECDAPPVIGPLACRAPQGGTEAVSARFGDNEKVGEEGCRVCMIDIISSEENCIAHRSAVASAFSNYSDKSGIGAWR
jgi:hypothetical protein